MRQASLLGAAWTVGSIAALAAAGADSVTYYETTGWRGVLERALGSPMPERFPSRGGQAFPLYHVLADIAEWAGGTVLEVEASQPNRVRALAMAGEDGARHALVANVTPEPQRALVRGLGERLHVRLLDEASAQTALHDPGAFRSAPGCPVEGNADGVWLALGPFAVARVEAAA
ncbi:hypothetical protein BH23CHL8_BH23CHL8_00570 [soil metagenome]